MPIQELHPECVTASREATVLDLAQEMDAEAVGTVVIVDDKRVPVGIVTDRDILCRVIAASRDETGTTALEVMSAPLVCASSGVSTLEALEKMKQARVRRLPIVDEDGVLVGAIGVSGSAVENDHKVALAGVEVLGVSELPEHPWRT